MKPHRVALRRVSAPNFNLLLIWSYEAFNGRLSSLSEAWLPYGCLLHAMILRAMILRAMILRAVDVILLLLSLFLDCH